MPSPSVTYQFIAGTTISDLEHNQNNQDLISALNNGFLDMNWLSANMSGPLHAYGNVTIGGIANSLQINAKISASLKPSSGKTLGTADYPFRHIYLDNQATDGGTIYFGAATHYLKCAADGSDIDVGGFTSFDPGSGTIKELADVSGGSVTVIDSVNSSGETEGTKRVFPFLSTGSGSEGTSGYIWPTDASFVGYEKPYGYIARKAGSIAYVRSLVRDGSSGTVRTINYFIRKNGTDLITLSTVSISSSGQIVKTSDTFTRGTYTFAAGDIIQLYFTRPSLTTEYLCTHVGVYYDA